MTVNELLELLGGTGIPFVHHRWVVPQEPPCGAVITPYANNFSADGIVYYSAQHFQIELYTIHKDPGSEKKIESALTGAGIYYDKTEIYIDSEKLYQTTYDCEV